MLGLYITKLLVFVEFISWQKRSIQFRNQIKMFRVNRKEIDIILVKLVKLPLKLTK